MNCSPIDASFQAGVDTPVDRDVRQTIAEGTAIKQPLRLRQIIAALRATAGSTIAITEAEIVEGLRRLCNNGLFAEPTSASAAAAFERLSSAGTITPAESTVVLLTGSGLKAASTAADLLADDSA